jgi:peptide/nickel transport system permease protein
MIRYALRRLLIVPFTLWGLTVLIFAMLQLLEPAERAALYITSPPRNPEALAAVIRRYGLDDPIYVQYGRWIGQALQGDLGWSKTAQQPVARAIGTFFPATLELTLWSFVPIMVFGVWLGMQAATHHDRWIDHSARVFSILGYSFPTFVFGLLMLMIFYAWLAWFPPGRLSPWATTAVYAAGFRRYTGMHTLDALLNGRFDIWLDALRHLVLPALTLACVNWALVLRVTRSAALEALTQEYVTVAHAKGLSPAQVTRGHVRPNAMIPVATTGGLLFVWLLSGAVIVETVFDFHGMGWWAANAALRFDAISVLGITLFNGVLLLLINLVVDLLYAVLDPRIRVT